MSLPAEQLKADKKDRCKNIWLEKVSMVEIEAKSKSGHRERLKAHFVAGEEGAYTDEALLELLLTYAIPQKDVQPLARKLITTFGSLSAVLSADIATLCKQEGIKEHSAVLLKLIDWIRKTDGKAASEQVGIDVVTTPVLFPEASPEPALVEKTDGVRETPKRTASRPRTGLFGKSMLEEAIEMLPQLPDTRSAEEARDFLKNHLRFSGQTTRERRAQYIVQRMFPDGYVDRSLLTFARTYAGRQELRDVCFYRFCKAEPLMYEVIEQLFLPAMSAGQLERNVLRDYLDHRFPSHASTKDCTLAIVETLVAGRVAAADRLSFSFSYRDISPSSLAFILHSEFPERGMFDIGKLEQNRAIQAMVWQPAALIPALYELRNRGIISKVSEIDAVRQFTTKYTLEQVCEMLAGTGTRP
jgi:hypothetical protein